MAEEVDLVVRPFVDGPAAGDKGEVPADRTMIVWRFVRGVGYCRYDHGLMGMTFEGTVLPDQEAMVAWMAELTAGGDTVTPYLHADSKHPHSRVGRFTQGG